MKSTALLATVLAVAAAVPTIDTTVVISKSKRGSHNLDSFRVGERALKLAFAETSIRAHRSGYGNTEEQSAVMTGALLRYADSDEKLHTVSRRGYTANPCRSDSNCRAPRKCVANTVSDANPDPPCLGQGCVCFAKIECTADTDCPSGEVCETIDGFASQICFVDLTSPGLTADPCESDENCEGERTCVQGGPFAQVLANPEPCVSPPCICLQEVSCSTDQECPSEEVCTTLNVCVDADYVVVENPGGQVTGAPTTTVPTTTEEPTPTTTAPTTTQETPPTTAPPDTSQTTVPPGGDDTTTTAPPSGGDSPTTAAPLTTGPTTTTTQQTQVPPSGSGSDDDPVCVDARALSHLSADELVFKEHKMANVLCDSNESCATPGHIVVHKGTAMRMSSYCGLVGCSKQRMLVNSPSYRRAMRVKASTEELHFTAFAARYDTRFEEVFLTAAVHSGL